MSGKSLYLHDNLADYGGVMYKAPHANTLRILCSFCLSTPFEGLSTLFGGLSTLFEGLSTHFEGLSTLFEGLSR
jgi:hypothetical protein